MFNILDAANRARENLTNR